MLGLFVEMAPSSSARHLAIPNETYKYKQVVEVL